MRYKDLIYVYVIQSNYQIKGGLLKNLADSRAYNQQTSRQSTNSIGTCKKTAQGEKLSYTYLRFFATASVNIRLFTLTCCA